ncbi:MAG: hypothetical protein ACRDF4_08775, partial [Rhabdochlamydiaceae bacterium]
MDVFVMDSDDAWAGSTGEFEEQKKKGLFLNPLQGIYSSLPRGRHVLKKIQLLPLVDKLSPSSSSQPELLPTPPPVTNIKPPPLIFTDLWGDSDASSSKPDIFPPTTILTGNETIEEHQNQLVSENNFSIAAHNHSVTIPLDSDKIANELWRNENTLFEITSEDQVGQGINSFDPTDLFHDLDLFDIDAVLARQEEDFPQEQECEQGSDVPTRGSQPEKWGGFSSLIYVDWSNEETAERDALERLGYANIALSKETRAFIIQAARNARLPHKQEIQLTTQLA